MAVDDALKAFDRIIADNSRMILMTERSDEILNIMRECLCRIVMNDKEPAAQADALKTIKAVTILARILVFDIEQTKGETA